MMKIQTDFYTLAPFQNLLYIESYNSWDERVVSNFAKHVRQLALQHYKEKPWAVLHDGEKWELGTPAIESMITQLINTPLTKTITHHAFVAGRSEIKKWQVEKIFENVRNIEARIFETLTDAQNWLSRHGYTHPPNSLTE